MVWLFIKDSTCASVAMNSMLEKICPNFITYYIRICSVYLSKKFGKKQKSYDGVNELEEEEFIITALPNDKIKAHEQMHNSPSASLHTFAYPIGGHRQQKGETVEVQQESRGQFRINLEPYDKYYEMIEEKTRNIDDYFNQHKTQIQLDLSNNRTHFKAFEIPATNGFKFIFTYHLPCSYSFYHATNTDIKTVSLFSRNIQSFELLETVHPNLSLFGLSFKKILGLGLEPRLFNYLKYVNNSSQKQHWQITLSLNTGQTYRKSSSAALKEAQIFSATHIRQKNKKIEVEAYLQVDLRSIIRAPKIVAKGLREVGFYLQNFYQHAQNHYHEEVA